MGFQKNTKKHTKIRHQNGHQNGTNLGVISRPISKQLGIWVLWGHLGSTLDRLGSILGSFWGNFGGHFFVILDAVLQTFYVFCRVSVGSSHDSYLCWNTPIMFPDVFQDTLFYEYYLQNHSVEYCTDTVTCFRNILVRLQHYSQDTSCRH